MNSVYSSVVLEARSLMKTYTIKYPIGKYSEDLFSSTYDGVTKWVRNTLDTIERAEKAGKESELYKYLRRFRGRAGDLTLKELEQFINRLESIN